MTVQAGAIIGGPRPRTGPGIVATGVVSSPPANVRNPWNSVGCFCPDRPEWRGGNAVPGAVRVNKYVPTLVASANVRPALPGGNCRCAFSSTGRVSWLRPRHVTRGYNPPPLRSGPSTGRNRYGPRRESYRRGVVDGHGPYYTMACMHDEETLSAGTLSNGQRVDWAAKPENQPPQEWWDDENDPFG